MKKLFVVCASAFLALSMSSVFAQSNNDKGKECCKKTEAVCVEQSNCGADVAPGNEPGKCFKSKDKCKKKDGKKGKKHGDKKGKKGNKEGRRGDFGPMKALRGIDLTDAQKAKVEALKADMQKDREKTRIELGKKKENMRAKFNEDIKKILTNEQYAKYQANLVKGGKVGKGDMRGGRKGAPQNSSEKIEYKKGPAPKVVTNN